MARIDLLLILFMLRKLYFPCLVIVVQGNKKSRIIFLMIGSRKLTRAETRLGPVHCVFLACPRACNFPWKAMLAQTPSCPCSDSEKIQRDKTLTQVLMLCSVSQTPVLYKQIPFKEINFHGLPVMTNIAV